MSTMSPQQVQMYKFHGEVTYWVLLCVWSALFCNVKPSNNLSSVFGGMHTWSVISCAQEAGVSKNKMPAIIFSIFIQWYLLGNSLIFMLSNALWAREFSKCPSDPPQEGAHFGKSQLLGLYPTRYFKWEKRQCLSLFINKLGIFHNWYHMNLFTNQKTFESIFSSALRLVLL